MLRCCLRYVGELDTRIVEEGQHLVEPPLRHPDLPGALIFSHSKTLHPLHRSQCETVLTLHIVHCKNSG